MICQPNVMQKCKSAKGFPITHVFRNGSLTANPLMESLTLHSQAYELMK
jgi:hypothetical protein